MKSVLCVFETVTFSLAQQKQQQQQQTYTLSSPSYLLLLLSVSHSHPTMMSPDHVDTEEISLSPDRPAESAHTITTATAVDTTVAAAAAAAAAAIEAAPQLASPPRVYDQPTGATPQLRRAESEQIIRAL